jgi:hypothetical protein
MIEDAPAEAKSIIVAIGVCCTGDLNQAFRPKPLENHVALFWAPMQRLCELREKHRLSREAALGHRGACRPYTSQLTLFEPHSIHPVEATDCSRLEIGM